MVVVPATLAGHALAYALTGRSAADGHHAWMQPAWECSLALLATICMVMVGGTLLRAGLLVRTNAERSFWALWPRLALAQLVFFSIVERAEGTHAGLTGCIAQLFTAAIAALLLASFARMLLRCERCASDASRYLERLLNAPASMFLGRAEPALCALSVRAGRALFSRPPPVS